MAITNTPLLGLPYAGAETDETYAVLARLFVKDGQKMTLPEIIEKYTPTIGSVYIKAADWTAADGTANAYDAKITISGLESDSMILIYPATDADAEKAKRLGIRAKAASGVANDDTFVIVRATGGDPTVTEGISLVYIALRGFPDWSAGLTPPGVPYATVIGVDPYIATEEGDRDDIAASQRLVTEVVGLRLKSADLPAKLDEYRDAKGLIDKTVGDLVNYYTKAQTLTKDEINALVSAIPKFKIEVVTSLPTSNISETTVYLVKSGDDDTNLYTEYIRTNGAWEKLGTQTVDLTGYATEAWVNDILAAYVKTVDMEAYVAGLLQSYLTKDEADKTYQPAGNYLTTDNAPAIINAEVNNVVTQRKEELQGEPGKDGETPYIGANGNWWIGNTDTGQSAGEAGHFIEAGETVVPAFTNLADPSTATDDNPDYTAGNWVNGAYFKTATIAASSEGQIVTNKIYIKPGQILRVKGFWVDAQKNNYSNYLRMMLYKADGTPCYSSYVRLDKSKAVTGSNTDYRDYCDPDELAKGIWCLPIGTESSYTADVAYLRISGYPVDLNPANVIITVGDPPDGDPIEYKTVGGVALNPEVQLPRVDARLAAVERALGTGSGVSTIISRNLDVEHIVNAACKVGKYTNPLWSLLITTDVHGDQTRFASAVSYFNSMDAIKAGICLGDIQSGNATSGADAWYTEEVAKANKPWYTVLGNHDLGNSANASISTTPAGAFAALIQPTLDKIGIADLTTPYYAIKDAEHSICLVVLNCYDVPDDKGTDGNYIVNRKTRCFSQAQLDWFVSELAAIPAGYHLVVAMHNEQGSVTKVEGVFTQDWEDFVLGTDGYRGHAIIADIVAAWTSGTTINKTYAPYLNTDTLPTLTVNADFTARGAGIFVAHVNGHYHRDAIGHYTAHPEQTVISLCTTCATAIQNQFSDLPRALGTKAEDAITVMAVDTASKQIRIVRVGSNYTDELEERTYAVIEYGATT